MHIFRLTVQVRGSCNINGNTIKKKHKKKHAKRSLADRPVGNKRFELFGKLEMKEQ